MKLKFATAIIVVTLFGLAAFTARADDNSWTNDSGKWETAGNWSLGVPPTSTQSAILITNDTTKTVTIDATTSGSFPDTMTISNLSLSAPTDSTNTLSLLDAGTNTPLHVVQSISLGTGGVLSITDSAVLVDGAFVDGGSAVLLDGILSVTNGPINLGGASPGALTVFSGTVQGADVGVGGGSTLTTAGGTVGLSGGLGILGGSVWVASGHVTATNGWTTIMDGGQMTVSNGTVLAGFVYMDQGTNPDGGMLKVAGGTTALSGDLVVGPSSVWVEGGELAVTQGALVLGDFYYSGQMTVSNGVVLASSISIGQYPYASGSLELVGGETSVYSNLDLGGFNCGGFGELTIDGGNLFVTNAAHDAVLEVRTGTIVLNAGRLEVDRLVMTTACGLFVRGGGTLLVRDLLLDPNLDADGDGIPNGFEQAHGLDPLNAADGNNGTTNSWTGGTGKWETTGDWSLGILPFVTQSQILITNDGNNTVTIDSLTASNFSDSIFIRGLTVSAPTDSTNSLVVSDTGTSTPLHVLGAMSIDAGGELTVTNSAVVVDDSLSVRGTVTMLDGTLTVTNGATSVDGGNLMTVSNGTALLQDMYVGPNGEGTLTVAGGTITLSSDLYVVQGVSGASTVWVTDGQLTVTNGTVEITGEAWWTTSQMVVSNGTILARDAFVGGSGTLTISGGVMSLSSSLTVDGLVWVAGGGLAVSNGPTDIEYGQFTVSDGTVLADTVSVGLPGGGGATTARRAPSAIPSPRVVVLPANGALIMEGGTETILSSLVVGDCNADGTGIVDLEGGSLFVTNATHDAFIDVSNGQLILNAGVLQVDRLVMTNSCGLFVRGGGTLIVGSVVLDPNLDADGDGIPNGFEQAHGLDPLNAADGNNGTTNSWTGGTGKWETTGDWSLGILPFITQSQILITNDGNNTVTIDSLTASNFSDSIFIRGLTVSAPTDSTNSLVVSDAGTNAPLHLLGALNIGDGGELTVTNSAVLVDDSLSVGGGVTMIDGSLTATNGTTYIGGGLSGQMTVSNGTVLLRDVSVVGNGTLTTAGGTTTLAADMNVSGAGLVEVNDGELDVTNGALNVGLHDLGMGNVTVSGGVLLAGYVYLGLSTDGWDSQFTVSSGTASVSGISVLEYTSVWVTGGQLLCPNGGIQLGDYWSDGSMVVSNGTVLTSSMNVGVSGFAQGTLTVSGGAETISSQLIVGDCVNGGQGVVTVEGGGLFVTNATHDAILDLRSGQVTLNGGVLQVDVLVMTNSCGVFVSGGGTLVVGSLVLDPNLSAVGDGIPNGWKQQYGLDPFDPNLANEDPLGKGMNNLQQYLAGLDPTNPASAFRITGITPEGDDLRVTWTMGDGKTNALQATAGDLSGGFTNDFSDIFTVTNTVGTTTNYLDLGAATNFPSRFYRVRLVP